MSESTIRFFAKDELLEDLCETDKEKIEVIWKERS